MATRALRPPSILLVSNSIDERAVYARSLRAWGYRVVYAATTVLAYQIATTRPMDVVVTDGHCAGSMSGLELTRRLRIHTRTTTVRVIVLTSVTRRHDGELSIKAGADIVPREASIRFDPISWTPSERWIRCRPWQTGNRKGSGAASLRSSRPARCAWSWMRASRWARRPAIS